MSYFYRRTSVLVILYLSSGTKKKTITKYFCDVFKYYYHVNANTAIT